MRRREILKSIGLVSPFTMATGLTLAKSNSPNSWLIEFSDRWDVSELYTREVFNAMPEEYLTYKPTPEIMSFGKQFTHLAMGTSIYAAVLRGDNHIEEPEANNKQVILEYMDKTSAEFKIEVENLTEEKLYTNEHKHKNDEVWGDFSLADILLLAYHHAAHHRAQAIVYLRLKNVVPPKYQF